MMMLKKGIGFLWLLFICNNPFYAQTHDDSLKTYNEMKDWAVCGLTISYMEDLRGWDNTTKEAEDYKKEFQTYMSLKKENQLGDEIDLNIINQQLKEGGWEDTQSKVFDKYWSEFKLREAIDFEKIIFLPKKVGNARREEFVKNLQMEYSEKIQSLVPELSGKGSKSVKDTSSEKGWYSADFVNSMLGVAFLLSLVLNVFLAIKKNKEKKNKQVKREKDKELIRTNEHILSQSQNKVFSLTKERDKLNSEITELRERLMRKEYDQKVGVQIPKSLAKKKSVEITKNSVKELSDTRTTVFTGPPFKELHFSVENTSEDLNAKSLYKIVFNTVSKQGEFEFVEVPDFVRAINSPLRFLAPVCIYENAFSSNVSGIKMVEKGSVKLEGNDWVVNKKMRIKFIK